MNQQPKIAQLKEDSRTAALGNTSALARSAASQVEVTDPIPPKNNEKMWRTLGHAATIGVGFVALITTLYFARSIIMPVLAALIIGITMSPLQKYAAEYKIPPVLTAALLVLTFFGLLYLVSTLLLGAVTGWLAQNPDIAGVVKDKFRWIEGPLGALRDLSKALGEASGPSNLTVAVETGMPTIAKQAIGIITPAVSEFLVFFGTLLFFLVSINKLRRQLITWFGTRHARLRVVRIWNDIEQNLITYLSTVTVINVGLGIATTLMLYLVGFPNPVAFGVLACVLNYIPYVGPAILALTLFLVGLIATPTLGSAILPPFLFVAIATVEGHFLTPALIGHRLTLSPFLVFLAVAFWTWLWGPLGTFMATPLLIVSLVVLSHLFPREETTVLPK